MGNRSSKNENGAEQERQETTEEREKPMSYWSMMKQGYQDLVSAIIRPPRCQYDISHLGPKIFDFCGKTFHRKDFELTNPRTHTLVCSIWEPAPQHRCNNILPCVIYMHGNSSARLEALPQLALVLSLGATLLSFDFSGSGLSDGEYVSLGAFEKDDLKCVIEYLRSTGTTSTIALWGRSMGAATALLHGERDPSIAGMILDSSFADLHMLAEEMVEKGRQHGLYAPGFVVKLAIRFIRSSVQKTAKFDIKALCPIEHADRCYIPALFVAAEGDEFVPPHHSQLIYQKYAGDKNVILVDGDHNSARPRFLFDSASIFLINCLQVPEGWLLDDPFKAFAGLLPWHLKRASYKKKSSAEPPESSQRRWSAGSDPEEEPSLGMTAERQAEMRKKLYRMLGDKSLGADACSRQQQDERPFSPGGPADERPFSQSGKAEADQAADSHMEPWACEVCTLINDDGDIFECSACGTPRCQP